MRRTFGKTALLLLFALLASLPLAGCSLLRGIAGDSVPTLTFQRVRFAGWSLDGVRLDLVYRLDNPYRVPLELAEVSYQLEVEGRRIVAGSPNQGLRIRPRRTQTLVFPATVRFRDVIPTVRDLFTKDRLAYRASGRIGVDTPVGVISLPISKSGSIDVPDLPSLRITGISIPRQSLTRATIAVALEVTNRNAFPVPLGGLDYALRLGGSRVGGGKARGGVIPAGESRRIEIPVGIDVVGAGRALAALLAGHPADVGLSGKLDLGSFATPFDLRDRLRAR